MGSGARDHQARPAREPEGSRAAAPGPLLGLGNRQLGQLLRSPSRATVTERVGGTYGPEHEEAERSLNAIEYDAAQRGLPPQPLDWSHYRYVQNDAAKRRAFVRGVVEEGIRETGSFDAAVASVKAHPVVADDVFLLEQDAHRFAAEFTSEARLTAERMLAESLTAITGLLRSYGLPPDAAARAAERILKGSGTEEEARHVVQYAKQTADDPGGANAPGREAHREDLASWVARLKFLQDHYNNALRSANAGDTKARDDLKRARQELAATWIEAERAHPVLAAYRINDPPQHSQVVEIASQPGRAAGTHAPLHAAMALERIDLGGLDTAGVDDEMKLVLEQVLPKIAHIAKANQLIRSGELSPLALPSVVGLTRANLHVPDGTIRAGVVNDLATAATPSEPTILIAASIALALITLIPTGGASIPVAAGIAGAGLAAYSAIREYEHYDQQTALVDTNLDRARALSDEEPSLTGFAIALVSLGLEGLPLIHAFQTAIKIRRLLQGGKEVQEAHELVEELNKLGMLHGDPELGGKALKQAREADPGYQKLSEYKPWDRFQRPEQPRGFAPPESRPDSVWQVRNRYRNKGAVRAAVVKELTMLPHGPMDSVMPYVMRALEINPGPNNARIRELLPIALGGLRDPALYGDVMADAWSAMRADHDINAALREMAANDGYPVYVMPSDIGLLPAPQFFDFYASRPIHMVDNALAQADHGAMVHLVQDIVVDRAFKAAGQNMKSVEFRMLLRKAEGYVSADKVGAKYAIMFNQDDERTGEFLWAFIYDSMQYGINQPETLLPALYTLLNVL